MAVGKIKVKAKEIAKEHYMVLTLGPNELVLSLKEAQILMGDMTLELIEIHNKMEK